MSKVRSGKRDIDKAKKAKQAEKRQKRQGGFSPDQPDGAPEADLAVSTRAPMSDAEILEAVQRAHARLEAGDIDFDEFDEIKADLLSQLDVG